MMCILSRVLHAIGGLKEEAAEAKRSFDALKRKLSSDDVASQIEVCAWHARACTPCMYAHTCIQSEAFGSVRPCRYVHGMLEHAPHACMHMLARMTSVAAQATAQADRRAAASASKKRHPQVKKRR